MNEQADPNKPTLRALTSEDWHKALHAGWQDFMAAPLYGLFFSAVMVVIGWGFLAVSYWSGVGYWLVFAITGFPMLGPFLAIGLYEVSRRRAEGLALSWREILGVVNQERSRQLPWLCAILVIIFLFWLFLAHLIFALFFGLSSLINISSSYEEFFALNGLSMLLFGGAVGAAFAALIYAISVFGMPMVLAHEVDFVSAMLDSMRAVKAAPIAHLQWAAILTGLSFLALLPGFIGLFLAFPLLGHASWHLFDQVRESA